MEFFPVSDPSPTSTITRCDCLPCPLPLWIRGRVRPDLLLLPSASTDTVVVPDTRRISANGIPTGTNPVRITNSQV